MKKARTIKMLFCLIMSLLPLLVGCNDKIYYWEFTFDYDHVEEIKIIEASASDEYSVVKELDIKLADQLYTDIKSLEMRRYGTNLSHPSGLCFLIVFDNGEYDIIARKESKHYRYDGDKILGYNSWLRCDETQFDILINKYMGE